MPDQKDNPAAGGKRPLGLYLHIPFCRQKCRYCDFLSAPSSDAQIERYVAALGEQLCRESPDYEGFYVRTVFFGGGTPSLLTPGQMDRLMTRIREHYEVSEDVEVTVESNPGTLDAEKLAGYRAAGVNRLSIGLQSADDRELRLLGRIHDFGMFEENFRAARNAGFTNLNVDLMSALPGQTPEGWLDTLKKAAEFSPEHISAYSLIIEEGTPFWNIYGEEGKVRSDRIFGACAGSATGIGEEGGWPPLPSEEEERLMYEQTAAFLKKQGYHRYEISNYAKPGRECLHNTGYWDRTDYAGFGLGASSLVDNVRWKITSGLEAYLHFFENGAAGGEPWKEERQVLTRTEQMEEFLFLGLRLTAGISLASFRKQFGKGLREVYGAVLHKLEDQGFLRFYEDGKKLKLTERGVDVSNYVLAQFLLEEEF